MITKHKLTFLQRSRRLLWYFIVTSLVLIAISITLARSLISNVGDLRDQLEEIASQYLEQPLRIDSFDAKIVGFTPTFIFKDVSLLEHSTEKVMVRFKEARIGISIINSIKYRKLSPKSFIIRGINLVVTQNKNNTFKVKGINVAEFDPTKNVDTEESSELSNWLFQQDKLKLENSTIHWLNSETKKVLKFSNINLLLKNGGNRHTLSGDWQLQSKMAKRFKIELDMIGDILNPASWEGAAYVKGEEVNITEYGIPSNLIPIKPVSGIYNFEVWADFKLGQLKEITGATNVRNLRFNSSKRNKIIEIEKMGAVWRWDNLADGWALNIDRFHYEVNNKIWPLSRVLVESHHRYQPVSIIDIYTDKLDIEDASQFIQNFKILNQTELAKLQNIDPHGRLFDTHFRFKVDDFFSDDFIFQSNFSKITFKPDAYIPGVENISGVITTTNKQGSIVIDSENSTINFSEIFREKIIISNINGRLNWKNINKEWHLNGDNFNISNSDIKLNSNFNLVIPENKKSPLIDLQINFEKGNIANAGKYYPITIMDKDLLEWLDSSLESGSVKKGGVVLQGRLNEFPYLNYNGKFEVNLESDNLVLNYLEEWPKIFNGTAKIRFTGSGFDINISKANMFNSEINEVEIYVKDFTAPELIIKGNSTSSTDDLFKFLVNSPIANDSRSVIEEFKITGNSKIDIQINVPLSEAMKENHSIQYNGSIVTNNSSISLYNNKIQFNEITGKLNFSEKGFNSDALAAICFNKPLKIQIYSQSKGNTFSHHVLVQGEIDSRSIQKRFNIPWMEKSTGFAKWQGIFNFGYSIGKNEVPSSLVVTSNLKGINLNLPAPLNKDSESELLISIESKFVSNNINEFNVSIDNKLSINSTLSLSDEKVSLTSASVNFDIDNKVDLKDGVILVRGDIHDINFDSWANFVKEFDINTDKNNSFISPDLNIIFDVNTFYISKDKEKISVSNSENELENQNKTTNNVASTSIDPRTMPGFSGEIRNIYYDKSKVGTLSFNFVHIKNGFEIQKLNLHSDNFDVSSTGLWHIFPYKNNNRFITKFTNVKFISSDLGAALSSLGFKSVLNKGVSNTELTVWWHDSPFNFSFDKLYADILLNVSDGEILDIDPKAGRLLGLLSLSNLPRRLFGDFSDVLGSGLSFDSAIGKVRIAKGVMSTEDITMDSSPAEIHIVGKTDLVKRQFDQKITVIPNITDTTAIIGGLVGGLQTFIITKILGSIIDLDEAEMRTYHVTGSWEKPVITRIDEPSSDDVTDSESKLDDSSDDN